MELDLYVVKNGEKLRCGYTTGSCAAAASKAAVYMLENQERVDYIEIDTPAGIDLKLKVHDKKIGDNYAEAAIEKDAGDDPDVTDGMKIYARVTRRSPDDGEIRIDGGQGIGRVTARSVFGEIGEAAINKVPKKMIQKEIKSLSNVGYDVLIFAPEGEERGRQTYNENIGIVGGISIVGTKGIVYPMSEDALIKTIQMEIDVIAKEEGTGKILLVPGNYGETMAEELELDLPQVKISNYLGETLSYLYSKGFRDISLIGHIGKFSKLSIGIFNTHSKIADSRLEAFIYYLAMMQAPYELLKKVEKTLTAEEALNICIDNGYSGIVKRMEEGAEARIRRYLKDQDMLVDVKIYSMERGFVRC